MNSLKIEATNSSYGRWVIRLSETTFRFFWKKEEAKKWLTSYEKVS